MSTLLILFAVVFLAMHGQSYEIYSDPDPNIQQQGILKRGLSPDSNKIDPHTDAEKTAIVNKHNEYRRQVHPTASNMLEMQWNDDLEHWAELWASSCHWGHGWTDTTQNENYEGQYPNRGQSMWLGEQSEKPVGTNCVQAWHDNEIGNYDYRSNTCLPDTECDHYKLVIFWKTTAVGCARAFCDQLFDINGIPTGRVNKWIEVCNYAPGITEWRPYKDGDSCSECKPGYGCENGNDRKLCKCDMTCPGDHQVVTHDCRCSCEDGWFGDNCDSQECRNYDSRCWGTWSTRSFCYSNRETYEKCPAMCNRCTRG